ncbi:GGDEF domain-containing protein, partial [Kibdelosporangium lantanae]
MPQRERTSQLPDGLDRDRIRERHKLARKWAYLISATTYVPLSQDQLEEQLLDLLDQVLTSLRQEPFVPDVAAEVTRTLAKLNCSGADSIRCTVDVLGKALQRLPEE